MTTATAQAIRPPVVYPHTDGKPMAENTLQFEWIVKIKGGLDDLFAGDPEVFVAGDLFWYPVEGHPEIVAAPDAMVAFGRPKGHRMSYRQWEEGGVAPQVVFEVISPGNRFREMLVKFDFYRRYGVEEYYVCNPDPAALELTGYVRRGGDLVEVASMRGHVSPRLGIRFEMGDDGLRLVRPDGDPLLTYEELALREHEQRDRADRAERERERAERERDRERERAEAAVRELEALRERLRAARPDDSARSDS